MPHPYLYSVIPSETLHRMLETFFACINLPIQLLDEKGVLLDSCGETNSSYCRCFRHFLSEDDSCEKLHSNASRKAIGLGEAYIFSCHANLTHITFPLLQNSNFLGSVLVGPFLMENADSTLVTSLTRQYSIPTEALFDLYDELRSLPVIAPEKARHISKLLYYLFFSLVSDSQAQLRQNQETLLQQSRINESIQMYKTGGITLSENYPYHLEKALITKVKTGSKQEAKGILNKLLGYVLFSEGNSLDTVKARATELTTLLSRAVIEGGASMDTVLKLNNQFLKNFQKIDSMDILCLKLQETVETFIDSMFNVIPSSGNQIMKKSLQFIAQHYMENLTLEDVAAEAHLNPSYFSTLFKQTSGLSFKEYLNMVRIEESKRLLANTDYTIIDIAVATGFENQSYFSKVFKKYTNMTPKQYRQDH